jgi:PAS domain S-box-containing protein
MRTSSLFGHRTPPALERLLAGVVTHLPRAVAVVAADDGTIVFTNTSWNRMFAYEEGEAVGHHLSSVNAPSDERFPGERIRKIAAGLADRGVWTGRVQNVRKDGVRLWCSETISEFDYDDLGRVWVMLYAELP